MSKKNYILVALFLITASVFAQAPENMSYQAVVRTADNGLVTNQQVGMQISILQGSTAVYEETQTPISNTNGLVSLEIGLGTVVSGSFAEIEWSAGTYFIKTEVDPAGGTNYTITGTSQLLSVPYALYAKTSGSSMAGPQGDTGAQGAKGETGEKGDNGATGPKGETGADGNFASHAIGDTYGGGIVFFVYDNGQHGLIAAKVNQSGGIRWHDEGSSTNTRARANGVGAGLKNTAIIIANQGSVDGNAFAATVCNEYSVTVAGVMYGDWYLPSTHELSLLYKQKTVVGGFNVNDSSNHRYWSSKEAKNFSQAQLLDIKNGNVRGSSKDAKHSVRAIRAF